MRQKYMRLTWNGGRELELKWREYKMNQEYWDAQPCIKEVFYSA